MTFLNYIYSSQVLFETQMGHKATKIIIPHWRLDEILNETKDKLITDFLYLKKQRINGLDIVWTTNQDFITLV